MNVPRNLNLLISYTIYQKKQCSVFSFPQGIKSKNHFLNWSSGFIKVNFYYIYTWDKIINCVWVCWWVPKITISLTIRWQDSACNCTCSCSLLQWEDVEQYQQREKPWGTALGNPGASSQEASLGEVIAHAESPQQVVTTCVKCCQRS